MAFTLLSDSTMEGARTFGVAYAVDDSTYGQLKNSLVDLEEASGETHHLLPVPAVFIVDTEGAIRFSYVHPDYRVRIAPHLLVSVARGLRK